MESHNQSSPLTFGRQAGNVMPKGDGRGKANKRHGHCVDGHSRTYTIWRTMKARCLNPKCKDFKNYGARGITVVDRWVKSFENFLEDMGEAPLGLTIERKENSLGYCKENCKWATPLEQTLNRRSVELIEFNGQSMCFSHWDRELGVRRGHVQYRYRKCGWSIKRIVESRTEIRRRPPRVRVLESSNKTP